MLRKRPVKELRSFTALRHGLIMAFPFILAGSLSLVVLNMPIPVYQDFLLRALGGSVRDFFTFIYKCTIDSVSLILMCFVSFSYGTLDDKQTAVFYPVVALCSYLIFVYDSVTAEDMLLRFSAKWLFTALCMTFYACFMFRVSCRLTRRLKIHLHLFSSGVDNTFNIVLQVLLPITLTISGASVLHVAVKYALGDIDFYNFGSGLAIRLFTKVGTGYVGGLLLILLVHLLWFFGIHGSNILDGVSTGLFESKMTNMASMMAFSRADAVCTKTFIDVFVLMGGCGVSVCIIIALLLAGKVRRNRDLAVFSILPGLFNVNEPIIYGLPIFFNPVLLPPFLLAPLTIYTVSYLAVLSGIVPVPMTQVPWTMPVFFSGYLATGSWTGCLLQAVNIAVGTGIYIPFIRKMKTRQERINRKNLDLVVEAVMQSEKNAVAPELLSSSENIVDVAKGLADDLLFTMNSAAADLMLYYQPQVYYDRSVMGCEALLRWKHPSFGIIYPPVVVAVAAEAGLGDMLGFYIIEKACSDLEQMSGRLGYPIQMSVNITAGQLENPHFLERVGEIVSGHNLGRSALVFELTEQVSLSQNPTVSYNLDSLHSLGIKIAMDDFGMGHSSMLYLQEHEFDYIKLDGGLIRNLLANERCGQIVSSLAEFSSKAGIDLIAEYVETETQRNRLHELGCDCYQGYLYSQPLPCEKAVEYFLGV